MRKSVENESFMLKPLIVANWKMNPLSNEEALRLFKVVKKELKDIESIEIVICPPFTQLPVINRQPPISLKLGAQNCFWKDEGAYTGEISPRMLRNLGCSYIIIGHSERRKYFGETDEMINKKIRTALKNNLKPILCTGETLEEYKKDKTDKVLISQLQTALKDISKFQISNFKFQIAYEPVWAIGTGVTPNMDGIMSAKLLIRKILAKMYSRPIAEKVRILYGGSVSSKNANDFLKKAGMDGLLIGGASLKAMEFVRIVKSIL